MSIDDELADLKTDTGARLKMWCQDITEMLGDRIGKEAIAVWPMPPTQSGALPAICMSEDATRALIELASIGLNACKLPEQAAFALAVVGLEHQQPTEQW